MIGEGGEVRRANRLRVLKALPARHEAYVLEEVRIQCRQFVARANVATADRESAVRELVSEVMAKFLGVAGSGSRPAGADDCSAGIVRDLVHHDDPKHDGRVNWLLSEMRGQWAIEHRAEDIRRGLHGRRRDGGYRLVQLEEPHLEKAAVDPDDPLAERDTRRVWLGFLAVAAKQFGSAEDASIVLNLLARDDDLREDFGSEWPIGEIVARLNRSGPDPAWTDDRVDNAKRRIKNWVAREMRDRGLDVIELQDFFARCAPRRQMPPGARKDRTASRRQRRA